MVNNKQYRTVSSDGKTSHLYEADTSLLGSFGLGFDKCIEVADHHSDGTTTAHEREHEHGFLNNIFYGGRGKKK